MGKLRRQYVRGQPRFGGQLFQGINAKGLMNLVSVNRLIGTGPDPRTYRTGQPLLFQLSDDALHAPMLLNEVIDHQGHFGADYTAQYSVEHSHGIPLNALGEQVANFLEKHLDLGRRGRGGHGCRLLESVDGSNADKQHKGDDDEVKNRLNKRAVLD